eukprot:944312-Alexandrium_andersonii.AAC.1
MPTVVCGDLNASVRPLPSLAQQLASGAWTDIGSIAQAWGKEAAQPTCNTHNAHRATRVD